MSLYCAICQYPAPCGRDHGEEPDGTPVHAVTFVHELWVTDSSGLVDVLAVDTWQCPHCREFYFLNAVRVHVQENHDSCLSCQAEGLVCAGILAAQARQRRGEHIS